MTSKNFSLQPTLQGELLTLKPLKASDFETLYGCASDPLIWELHPQWNRYEREVFTGFFKAAMESHGAFAIFENETGGMIGSSRYYDLKSDLSQISIGYTFLTRKYWGGNYNRELKNLMLTHAFQFVEKVIFEIGEKNLRSRRAIEKIGARLQGMQELDGKAHCVYVLEKATW